MDDDLAKLKRELAAHSVRVNPDGGVVIYSGEGQQQFKVSEAIEHIRSKAAENGQYLLKLWHEASDLTLDQGHFPSNDLTRRMFISAVKHLCKQSMQSEALKAEGIYDHFREACRNDATVYSHSTMSQLVDFRLAIDWISHLVAYDTYRAELLEAYDHFRTAQTVKTAAGGTSRSYDFPEDKPMPWWQYKDQLYQQGTDRGPKEQDRQRVKEDAVKDQGDNGTILDEYDEIAHGMNFRKRMRGTMLDMWQKNQIDRDPRGAQEGARPWGSTDVNPHEKTLSR